VPEEFSRFTLIGPKVQKLSEALGGSGRRESELVMVREKLTPVVIRNRG